VRALFPENKVRFARAEQLWSSQRRRAIELKHENKTSTKSNNSHVFTVRLVCFFCQKEVCGRTNLRYVIHLCSTDMNGSHHHHHHHLALPADPTFQGLWTPDPDKHSEQQLLTGWPFTGNLKFQDIFIGGTHTGDRKLEAPKYNCGKYWPKISLQYDLFVVTSLKMNQLSPNFECKLPIMYGILAANFFAIWSAFPVLLWPPFIRLADGHCEMFLVCRPFSRRLISEVSWPIVTKLGYMFDGDCSL